MNSPEVTCQQRYLRWEMFLRVTGKGITFWSFQKVYEYAKRKALENQPEDTLAALCLWMQSCFKYKLPELWNSVLTPVNLEVREKPTHWVWNILEFKITQFTILHVLQELHKTGLVSKQPPEIPVISAVSLMAVCSVLISVPSQSSTEDFFPRSHKLAPGNGLAATPTDDGLIAVLVMALLHWSPFTNGPRRTCTPHLHRATRLRTSETPMRWGTRQKYGRSTNDR